MEYSRQKNGLLSQIISHSFELNPALLFDFGTIFAPPLNCSCIITLLLIFEIDYPIFDKLLPTNIPVSVSRKPSHPIGQSRRDGSTTIPLFAPNHLDYHREPLVTATGHHDKTGMTNKVRKLFLL